MRKAVPERLTFASAPAADVSRSGHAENPARTLAEPRNAMSAATLERNARIQASTSLRFTCDCVISNFAGVAATVLFGLKCVLSAAGHVKCASARAQECGASMVASVMSRPEASG